MTNESLLAATERSELEQFINRVRRAQKSVLLLDYDGTLAPFTTHRREAFPYKRVPSLIHAIMLTGHTRVAIITGRDAREVVSLLGVDPVPEIWGSHGLQRLKPDGTCEMPRIDPAMLEALAQANQWLAEQGLQHLSEFKPGGIALHWRGLPESSVVKLHDQVLKAWSAIAQPAHLVLLEFEGGIEIRVSCRNKGDALRTILNETGSHIPVAYLGDDATDEQAFCALGHNGLSILVRSKWRETHAQLWFRPPDDVLDFLTQWRQACGEAR